MTMQKLHNFVFAGQTGTVFVGGFVKWGGMSFQIEAASSNMLAAINAASK